MSFLRFVASERRGPFALAYAMARDSDQPIYYRQSLREHLDWFDTRLPVPDRFRWRLGRASTGIGVCWFKAGAVPHISQMREMCSVLGEMGHLIVCCWTVEPGRLIYQDDCQIVALDHKRPAHMC